MISQPLTLDRSWVVNPRGVEGHTRGVDRWNRRSSPRIDVDMKLEGRTLDRKLTAQIVNLSARGLAMETDLTFYRGDRLSLSFALPEVPDLVRCIGEIVAVHVGEDGPRYSVRFQVIRPPQRLALEHFIDKQQRRLSWASLDDSEELSLDDELDLDP